MVTVSFINMYIDTTHAASIPARDKNDGDDDGGDDGGDDDTDQDA